MFNAISTAGSGLTVYRKWLDAISDNITNVNTVRPSDEEAFRARYVVAQSVGVPAEGMGLILGVDRFLDMCRTTVNVTGDVACAAYVARSEGYALLGDAPPSPR